MFILMYGVGDDGVGAGAMFGYIYIYMNTKTFCYYSNSIGIALLVLSVILARKIQPMFSNHKCNRHRVCYIQSRHTVHDTTTKLGHNMNAHRKVCDLLKTTFCCHSSFVNIFEYII